MQIILKYIHTTRYVLLFCILSTNSQSKCIKHPHLDLWCLWSLSNHHECIFVFLFVQNLIILRLTHTSTSIVEATSHPKKQTKLPLACATAMTVKAVRKHRTHPSNLKQNIRNRGKGNEQTFLTRDWHVQAALLRRFMINICMCVCTCVLASTSCFCVE